jgi:prepilin-type N-terminal cleavage/methylation domain-containing protein
VKHRSRIGEDQGGLTLIEFMMAIAIAGVIFMVLYTILDAALESYNVGQLRSDAVQHGRITTMRIINDIKYAEDIYIADDDRIYLRSPAEGDTSSHTVDYRSQAHKYHNVDYRYYPDTQIITRNVSDIPGAGEQTFMEGVASFSLTYRDSGNFQLTVPVSEPHKIRYIEIDIRLQEDEYEIALHNLAVLANSLPIP